MKTIAARLATLLMLTCMAGIAAAHDVRPGYLEIAEVEPGVYDVL